MLDTKTAANGATGASEPNWQQVEPDLPEFMLEATIEDDSLADKLDALEQSALKRQELRQYQRDGAEWLSTLNAGPSNRAHMLIDPPGLGKTLQAIEAANSVTPITRTILVVCPGYLQEQWYEYITKQHPYSEDPNQTAASPYDLTQKAAKLALLTAKPAPRWLVINYEMLRGEEYFNAIFSLPIETIIFDESQHLKNRDAQQSRRAFELTKKTTINNIFMLSATPIMREANDLFHQLHILDRYKFASYEEFLRDYTTTNYGRWGATDCKLKDYITVFKEEPAPPPPPKPAIPIPPTFPTLTLNPNSPEDNDVAIQNYERALSEYRRLTARAEQELYQYKSALAEHRRPQVPRKVRLTVPVMDPVNGLGKYMMGRTYEDVGLELPPLLENVRKIDLEPERRKAYDEMRTMWAMTVKGSPDFIVSASNTMKVMHNLRMLSASNNKIKAAVELLDETPGPHLIYTAYDRTGATLIYDLLRNLKPELYRHTALITGSTPPNQRLAIVNDPDITCVIGTMSSIGEGLNLQRFRTVEFFEGDWTPGAMHQRLTRVWRLRHDNDPAKNEPVLCYYLLSKNTIDEQIHNVRNARTTSARNILKVELSRA